MDEQAAIRTARSTQAPDEVGHAGELQVAVEPDARGQNRLSAKLLQHRLERRFAGPEFKSPKVAYLFQAWNLMRPAPARVNIDAAERFGDFVQIGEAEFVVHLRRYESALVVGDGDPETVGNPGLEYPSRTNSTPRARTRSRCAREPDDQVGRDPQKVVDFGWIRIHCGEERGVPEDEGRAVERPLDVGEADRVRTAGVSYEEIGYT